MAFVRCSLDCSEIKLGSIGGYLDFQKTYFGF